MTTTGMRPHAQVGTFQLEIQRATRPPSTPVTRPPRKPAAGSLMGLGARRREDVGGEAADDEPGTRPGRSAIAKAMKPDRRARGTERRLADDEEERADVG